MQSSLIETTLTGLREKLGQYVSHARAGRRVMILRNGRAVAALVSMRDFDALEEAQNKSVEYKLYQNAERMAKWEALKAGLQGEG